MRLWSIHPKYLDKNGLVGLWRQGLLAKAILEGTAEGYRHHPQLVRFRCHLSPVDAINAYLSHVLEEGLSRGYRFDAGRVTKPEGVAPIPVTEGQLRYEWNQFLARLKLRDPKLFSKWRTVDLPDVNPAMCVVPGDVEEWEVQPDYFTFVQNREHKRLDESRPDSSTR